MTDTMTQSKTTIGIIGMGDFGAFMLSYLAPYYPVTIYDPMQDLADLSQSDNVHIGNQAEAACQDIVILAMPVQALEQVISEIRDHVRPGSLVMDVCSVKQEPARLLLDGFSTNIDLISIHPLFGPQTGAKGIEGLRVSICNLRGERVTEIEEFLSGTLKLTTILTTPEQHDRQMAYVQGLTHLMSKILVEMDLPPMEQTTRTFDYMMQMMESVRYDSDQLFRAIENRNDFVQQAKEEFFQAARVIEQRLASHAVEESQKQDLSQIA